MPEIEQEEGARVWKGSSCMGTETATTADRAGSLAGPSLSLRALWGSLLCPASNRHSVDICWMGEIDTQQMALTVIQGVTWSPEEGAHSLRYIEWVSQSSWLLAQSQGWPKGQFSLLPGPVVTPHLSPWSFWELLLATRCQPEHTTLPPRNGLPGHNNLPAPGQSLTAQKGSTHFCAPSPAFSMARIHSGYVTSPVFIVLVGGGGVWLMSVGFTGRDSWFQSQVLHLPAERPW